MLKCEPRGERWVSARRMRGLVKLLGDAREIIRDIEARRSHLVEGITRLVGATFVATVVDEDFHPAGKGSLRDLAAWGLDGAASGVLSVLAIEGTARHPALRQSMIADDYREPLVWDRRARAPDRLWYRDSYFQDYVRPHHLDGCILGGARINETTLLGVGAMRESRDTPFRDEDMALLEGYAEAARGIWRERDRAAEIAAALPPRLRRLLALMLEGGSEKSIAGALGLSAHTIHTYVKQLYRAVGVGSRAELMSRARTVLKRP